MTHVVASCCFQYASNLDPLTLARPRDALTKRVVERARPDPQRHVFLWDGRLSGFGVRVLPSGRRTYIYQYRTQTGQQRRAVLGVHDPMTTEQARQIAEDMYTAVRRGGDPIHERHIATESRTSNSFEALVPLFVERYLKQRGRAKTYIEDVQATFNNHVLPRWRTRDIRTITRRDVNDLLDRVIAAGTPVAANRTLAAVRKLFNWALQRGILETSPIVHFERPATETPRDRVLSPDEIRVLWPHLESSDFPYGSLLQMSLATGQRREEVAGMRWRDLDERERVWRLPSELTKSRRAHVVPLSPLAIEILRKARASAAKLFGEKEPEYVFTTLGDRPFSGFSKARTRLDKAMAETPLPPWTIHDLRRTVATGLSRIGVPRLVVSRILNHADRSVTGSVYDQYEYLTEKQKALEAWSEYLFELLRNSANVT